jgi:hypothetical protein
MHRKHALAAALGAVVILGACGSGSTKQASGTKQRPAVRTTTTSTPPATAAWHPQIDPRAFSPRVTNRYFPLPVGATRVYEGTRDGQPMHAEITVTNETKVIMGVTTVVVRDVVTSNGALVEKTTDWYAQSASGDVWYFGEDTKEYTNGAVSSTHGSWEAGVDGAQPGIVMKGAPKLGDSYHQEYRPGEAEDMAKVLRIDPSAQLPAGTFRDVLVTEDTDPLNPDKVDEKHYAPGIGTVYSKRIRTGHHEETSYVKTMGV